MSAQDVSTPESVLTACPGCRTATVAACGGGESRRRAPQISRPGPRSAHSTPPIGHAHFKQPPDSGHGPRAALIFIQSFRKWF